MTRETTFGSVVAGALFDVPSDDVIARNRAAREQEARERAAEIEGAVEVLADCGALSRRRWREVGHALYARHVFAAHIQPFADAMTYSEMAARLNRIGIPRFRRGSPWTPQAVAEVRAMAAALREGRILLPDS
jgi:hypothetical protein